MTVIRPNYGKPPGGKRPAFPKTVRPDRPGGSKDLSRGQLTPFQGVRSPVQGKPTSTVNEDGSITSNEAGFRAMFGPSTHVPAGDRPYIQPTPAVKKGKGLQPG